MPEGFKNHKLHENLKNETGKNNGLASPTTMISANVKRFGLTCVTR